MIRFERENIDDFGNIRRAMIEQSESENIVDIVDGFVDFLKALSYPQVLIRRALLEEAEEIRESIKEDATMVEDGESED